MRGVRRLISVTENGRISASSNGFFKKLYQNFKGLFFFSGNDSSSSAVNTLMVWETKSHSKRSLTRRSKYSSSNSDRMKYFSLFSNKFIIYNFQTISIQRSHWDIDRTVELRGKLNPPELFTLCITFPLFDSSAQINSYRPETVVTFWHLSGNPHFKNAAASQERHRYMLSLYL